MAAPSTRLIMSIVKMLSYFILILKPWLTGVTGKKPGAILTQRNSLVLNLVSPPENCVKTDRCRLDGWAVEFSKISRSKAWLTFPSLPFGCVKRPELWSCGLQRFFRKCSVSQQFLCWPIPRCG